MRSIRYMMTLVSVLALPLLLTGCVINIGSCAMTARYEREMDLSAPLEPGLEFATKTHNGSVTVTGADTAECKVHARIVARAVTEEEAQELAEQTTVTLDRSGGRLTAKITRPERLVNKSVSVDLTVTLPRQTSLELVTHNGGVNVKNIEGTVVGTTHNGRVSTHQVKGDAKLQTQNGSVRCTEFVGNANMSTHNGGVDVDYAQSAPPVCDIRLGTHNGGIELRTPPNYSAKIEASTHNGSIHTDLPVQVVGKVSKKNLRGTIGAGEGNLHLTTHNGSIRIK